MVAGVFPLEGPRRAAGMAAAAGDWIFEVDADEIVGPDLAAEIRAGLDDDRYAWRKIPVDNYVGGRVIRHGWGGGSFGTTPSPQAPVPQAWRQALGRRAGASRMRDLRRRPGSQSDLRDCATSSARTSPTCSAGSTAIPTFKAQDLREHGGKIGLADNAFRGLRRFWKCYVKRGGWREGGWGLLISMMAGLYPLLSALRVDLDRPAAGRSRALRTDRTGGGPPRA